ncbi:MAG: GNAT family protein [Planctomycetota bacterium]
MSLEIKLDDAVSLRLLGVDDAQEFFDLIDRNRDHIARWMDWVAGATTVEQVADARRAVWRDYESRTKLQLGLIESQRIVGAIGLHGLDDPHGSAELGYWLSQEAQGRGLMTQAARALLDHGFAEYGLHRVYLTADAANARSIALAKRLGMRREGEMKQDVLMPGVGYRDSVLYAVLAEEWTGESL